MLDGRAAHREVQKGEGRREKRDTLVGYSLSQSVFVRWRL
jgi:hypothetical protein